MANPDLTVSLSDLQPKIHELFEYRRFPDLLQQAGLNEKDAQQFTEKLVDLQYAIYCLDHMLETRWELSENDLHRHWQRIDEHLLKFGIDRNKRLSYTAHIRKYQKHELDLRKGRLPHRFTMEYYYFYKSCDVKLLRRLIYEAHPILKKQASLADWRYFDLITEVNDDVVDLHEDLSTINGNLFLIRMWMDGLDSVRSDFLKFGDHIVKASHERFRNVKSGFRHEIHRLTEENVRDTNEWINTQTYEFNGTESGLLARLRPVGMISE